MEKEHNEVEAVAITAKEMKEQLARGAEGFLHDVKEFCKHLETFRDNIESLIQEYPLIMTAQANVKIIFSMHGKEVAEYEIGFGDSYIGDANGQRIYDSSAQEKD